MASFVHIHSLPILCNTLRAEPPIYSCASLRIPRFTLTALYILVQPIDSMSPLFMPYECSLCIPCTPHTCLDVQALVLQRTLSLHPLIFFVVSLYFFPPLETDPLLFSLLTLSISLYHFSMSCSVVNHTALATPSYIVITCIVILPNNTYCS